MDGYPNITPNLFYSVCFVLRPFVVCKVFIINDNKNINHIIIRGKYGEYKGTSPLLMMKWEIFFNVTQPLSWR